MSTTSFGGPSKPVTQRLTSPILQSIHLQLIHGVFGIFNIILRNHDLMGMVDGTEPYPPKHLLDSNGKETPEIKSVLSTAYRLNTARQVWTSLASQFASQSRSHINQFKRQLQNLKQGSQTCSEYIQQAKLLADNLETVGKPVDDDDLISYVTSGLNPAYNPFNASVSLASRDNPISFDDFQAELLSYELMLDNQNQSLISKHGSSALYSSKSEGPNKGRSKFSGSGKQICPFITSVDGLVFLGQRTQLVVATLLNPVPVDHFARSVVNPVTMLLTVIIGWILLIKVVTHLNNLLRWWHRPMLHRHHKYGTLTVVQQIILLLILQISLCSQNIMAMTMLL
ncbi:hypothetical protein MRB53_005996 [Persea americana]|uniref:Uncharacterized protein n=1 Tax=Persea americana TaxID=3435 RepID=A0ACC2MFT0_PERAE|nr:hypothetical protein MRB53_005996 [Persea americana]